MAMFPDTMPGVEPDFVDRAFWSHCNDKSLRFQACAECDTPRHPPTPVCPSCLSTHDKWVEAPQNASVYSYTVIHHSSHDAVKNSLPYVVATVEFEGLPEVRLVTNVMTANVDGVHIGMPVSLRWDSTAQSQQIPRFVPNVESESKV